MKLNPLPFPSKALKFKYRPGLIYVGNRMEVMKIPVRLIEANEAPGFKNFGDRRYRVGYEVRDPAVVAERKALLEVEDAEFSRLADLSRAVAKEFALKASPIPPPPPEHWMLAPHVSLKDDRGNDLYGKYIIEIL